MERPTGFKPPVGREPLSVIAKEEGLMFYNRAMHLVIMAIFSLLLNRVDL